MITKHNSLKLRFANIRHLCSNVTGWEPFLESNYPDIIAMWDKRGWLNRFWKFLCEWLTSFSSKGFCYSYTWLCSLCEKVNSFCMWLDSIKICGFLFMFLTVFFFIQSHFFFLYQSPHLPLCNVFDAIYIWYTFWTLLKFF